jgi:hypothetical protein
MEHGVQTLSYQTPASPAVLTELRALRLWHWRKVRAASKVDDSIAFALRECHDQSTTDNLRLRKEAVRADWALHMGAVQTLNRFFDHGDTAEKDALL